VTGVCVQVHCGPNTFVAKDFTVHSKMEGTVRFYKKKGPKTSVMHVTVDETIVADYDKSASTRKNAKLAKCVPPRLPSLQPPRREHVAAQEAPQKTQTGGELSLAVAAVGAGVGLLSGVGLLPAQAALSTAP